MARLVPSTYPAWVLLEAGVWVDSYRRCFHTGLPCRVPAVPLPEPAAPVYQAIADARGGRGGCWDVLAWRGTEVRFVEAKRARRDRIRESQRQWLDAALGLGYRLDAFLVVEWDLEDEAARTQVACSVVTRSPTPRVDGGERQPRGPPPTS
jgi:hypothetical protein